MIRLVIRWRPLSGQVDWRSRGHHGGNRGPGTLAAFWKDALGWEYRTQRPEEGWVTIQPPGGDTAMSVGFGAVPEDKTVKNRVHLDIRPSPGVAWEEERARLEALGATTLQYFEDAHYIMADPEGNEFCLLNPRWY